MNGIQQADMMDSDLEGRKRRDGSREGRGRGEEWAVGLMRCDGPRCPAWQEADAGFSHGHLTCGHRHLWRLSATVWSTRGASNPTTIYWAMSSASLLPVLPDCTPSYYGIFYIKIAI